MLRHSTHFLVKVHRPKIGHEVWDYQLPNLQDGKKENVFMKKAEALKSVKSST